MCAKNGNTHCHLANSQLMPMHTVPLHMNSLPDDAPLVVICHHGVRSYQVAAYLLNAGFAEVFSPGWRWWPT